MNSTFPFNYEIVTIKRFYGSDFLSLRIKGFFFHYGLKDLFFIKTNLSFVTYHSF